MEKKRPFVAMKYAMTLDGKIACENGDSKWVTGVPAREYVQELRKYYTGIMVGIETVLADNPLLTCRIAPECNPVRIVADSSLRIPLDCRLVQTAVNVPTIVACSEMACGQNSDKKRALERLGVTVIATKGERVDLNELLGHLAQRNVDSILLEGGGTLNASMLRAGLVDRVYAFIAPKLIGGSKAKTPVSGEGILQMANAWQLTDMTYQTFGADLLLTGRVQNEIERG
jgi:diaminohydroxyphosphoribosylaminopyrimidine deaminase/5-amino-6-(5-phosphoribosylamino)uracil reductase